MNAPVIALRSSHRSPQRVFGRLAATLLALAGLLAPVGAAQGTDTTYQDPQKRFTAIIPAGWTVEERQGHALVSEPEKAIKLYLLAVDNPNGAEAIAAGWKVVDPALVLKPVQTVSPPASEGVTMTQVVYQTPQERTVLGIAQTFGNISYLTLLDGATAAVARRSAQLNTIITGIKMAARELTDLRDAKALTFDAALAGQLDSFATKALAASKVPGAVVAVVQDGRVAFLKAYGVKELGKAVPVTTDTQFMIGSTGKSLTTMMMASLVDEGRMRWDTPAKEILPDFAVADADLSGRVTMRNLVCACTGVPRRDMEWIFNANDLRAADVTASLKGFQFFTGFGEAFQYSNQMVATGGYLAALAGGGKPGEMLESYSEQLRARVLAPIGMTATTLSLEEVAAAGRHAMPHGQTLASGVQPLPLGTERLLTLVAPAGAHWSTAPDLARYLITELNRGVSPDGRRVVSAANLEETWKPQVRITADVWYGLGWMIEEYKGLRVVNHGGNTFGFTAELAFLPEKGLAVVVLANAQGANLFTTLVRQKAIELAFAQQGDLEKQLDFAAQASDSSLKGMQARLAKQLDSAEVQAFLGTFENAILGSITLAVEDGRLFLDAGEFRTELRRSSGGDGKPAYLAVEAPLAGLPFKLQPDAAGKPTVVLTLTPDEYVFVRR